MPRRPTIYFKNMSLEERRAYQRGVQKKHYYKVREAKPKKPRKVPKTVEYFVQQRVCAKYSLTPEQYQMLRARACVLCGERKRNAFDHCHATGRFRNVLCMSCNHGLGNFKDNPALLRLAAQYVEHYAAAHIGTPTPSPS